METRDIVLVAGLGVAAFAAYQYFSKPTTPAPPPGYGGAQYIPAGGSWNGYANTSGQPVWFQALGATASIVNSLGQVMQTIPWGSFGGGGGYTGGNNNPDSGQGYWDDSGAGYVWVPNT